MIATTTYEVECNHCNTKQEVAVRETISRREKRLRFKCTSCHKKFRTEIDPLAGFAKDHPVRGPLRMPTRPSAGGIRVIKQKSGGSISKSKRQGILKSLRGMFKRK